MRAGPDRSAGEPQTLATGSVLSIDKLLEQLEFAWESGDPASAESFLSRAGSVDDAVALIYHEYCLREAAGHSVDVSKFLDRFPLYRGRLERLFGLRSLFGLTPDAVPHSDALEGLPEPGDIIGPFRLVRDLGSGAFARVYLAEQTDLADRLVVVKVSRRPSSEPQLLARARHPNIIDILRHATTDDGQLHILCMPYLGGAPLAAVLDSLADVAAKSRPRSAKAWLAALDRVSCPEESEVSRSSPIRQLLRGLSHADAMCWIIARLADALDVAHARGVLHGDLKPSNVLIASDGRPLLLDLNLAVEWNRGSAADCGGTPAYMSPERLRKLGTSTSGTEDQFGTALDRYALRRSDLYSLGLLLHEALTLHPPVTVAPSRGATPRENLDRIAGERERGEFVESLVREPRIPIGLRPILRRCLAPNVRDRYETARELAEDLNRHLNHRPLRHAPEPALLVRLRRPFLRHRRLTASFAFLLVASLIVGVLGYQSVRAAQRRAALRRLDSLWSAREPGVFRFEWVGSWRQEDPVEVGEIANRILNQFDALETGNWRGRDDFAVLPESRRLDLELWLLEHTWKYARVLGDRGDPGQIRRARSLLEHDATWAHLESFARERVRLSEILGEATPASLAVNQPMLDAYARGLALEPRHARSAREAFLEAVALAPDSFWVNYRLAACECRLGRYAEAADRLAVCLRSQPANAALWTQRAACLLQAGSDSDAEQACNRALALAPDSIDAQHTSALLHAWRGHLDGVEKSLEHFGWLSGRVHALKRWDLLVVIDYALRRQAGDRPSIEEQPRLGGSELDNAITHALRGYLSECDGKWLDAIHEYDQALLANADHLWALYRRGQVFAILRDRRSLEDCRALVEHDRAEELFGQVPQALRVFGSLLRESSRAATKVIGERAAFRKRAVALATQALDLARLGGNRAAIVETEVLLARTIAQTTQSLKDSAATIASHLRTAQRLDSALTEEILASDRALSLRPPLPDWSPPYDPIRNRHPYSGRKDRAANAAQSAHPE